MYNLSMDTILNTIPFTWSPCPQSLMYPKNAAMMLQLQKVRFELVLQGKYVLAVKSQGDSWPIQWSLEAGGQSEVLEVGGATLERQTKLNHTAD